MRKTIKLNNTILKQMKKMYYPKGTNYIDWMGFKITDINKPSYHHIEKAVDLRKNSPTYGKWVGVILTAENKKMFMKNIKI